MSERFATEHPEDEPDPSGEAADGGPHEPEAPKLKRLTADRAQIGQFVDCLFRYATDNSFVSLRSFFHDPRRPPADIRGVELFLDEVGLEPLVIAATGRATHVANLADPTVFAPPIATFAKRKSAKEADLVDGLALSAECDSRPAGAKTLLEGLLGPATVAIASGGTWTDPETGEVQDKLHLHWRLAEPTREPTEHQHLKRARRLIALLAGSDTSAVPMVHPLRWPGTWHLKGEPRMARIVECHPDREVHLEDVLDRLQGAANMRGIPLDDEPNRTNGSAAPADDDDLMALARAIPNDADTPWERWNKLGMTFWAASGGSDIGLMAFDAWSSKSSKHEAGATDARWRHYATSPPSKLSIGSLIYHARQAEPAFRLPSWDRHDAYDPEGGEGPEAREEAAERPRGDDWKKKLGAAIAEMNDRYFVSTLGGRSVIASLTHDDALQRERLVFSRKEDVRLLYNHQHYMTGHTQKGAEIWKDLGTAWIEHPRRRTFDRIALIPSGPVPDKVFNLWRGFGVEPRAGRWPTIDSHLREIVCAGNAEHHAWLMGWLAYCVQQPSRQAEVAVVLRGLKGIGKGMVGQMLMRIFRNHALHITHSRHLVGNFNAHLADTLLLFLDEAFWAGDKQGEGVLKGLITEPTVMIEPKGIDPFPMPNRLKILMASNAEWVVPASADERRYFVLDVSDRKRGDTAYFDKLYAAIEGDELAALLHDLLERDLVGWSRRAAPHTAGLNEQKLITGDSVTKFWLDCLHTGGIVANGGGPWPTTIPVGELHAAYINFAHDHGDRYPVITQQMAVRLRKLCPGLRVTKPHGAPRQYVLKTLDEHRAEFLAALNIEADAFDWRGGDGGE